MFQEAVGLIGPEPGLAAMLIPSMEQASTLTVFTQQQALDYLGACALKSVRMSPCTEALIRRI